MHDVAVSTVTTASVAAHGRLLRRWSLRASWRRPVATVQADCGDGVSALRRGATPGAISGGCNAKRVRQSFGAEIRKISPFSLVRFALVVEGFHEFAFCRHEL